MVVGEKAALKTPQSKRFANAERSSRREASGKWRFTATFTRSRRVVMAARRHRGDRFTETARVGGALPGRRYGAGNERHCCQTNPNEIRV